MGCIMLESLIVYLHSTYIDGLASLLMLIEYTIHHMLSFKMSLGLLVDAIDAI